MPAQIRPTRLDVTDRFPMVGFRIRADGGPSQAEVAIAIDPALFTLDRKKDRTAANFYSTRGNGGVRFQGSEAGYTVPPEVLARFIGNEKLYFGLATAGDGGPMKVAVMPNETSPYISIRGLSGRSMSRVRVLPNRQQRAAGYKRTSQEQLEWAGDAPAPGMAPVGNGASPEVAPTDLAPNGSAAPAHYDDGFGPMPEASTPAAQSFDRLRARAFETDVDPETLGIEGPAYTEPSAGQPVAQARAMALVTADYDRVARIAPSVAFTSGRSGKTIDHIVIHITDAPTTSSTVNTFTAADARASAHYLVGQDGEIVQFVSEDDTAWHAKGVNSRSVGIEHVAIKVGGADYPRRDGTTQHFDHLPPTDTQYCESAALVSYLCDKYGLTPDRTTIIGHREADPKTSHTSCPDGAWDWDHFMDLVTNRYCAPQPVADETLGLAHAQRAVGLTIAGSWTVNWDDVELIPQPSDFSCWAAAGAMLVGWRDRVSLTPETVGEICSRSTGAGLDPGDVSAFGTEMGLVAEPPVSYSVEGFRALLESSGPLWVAEALPGSLHAIIVTGLYSDGTDTFVRIADPWDRVVGTPGAPGAYASSHSTGSRYIMRYEDFHAQYESAINGDPPNRQILHSGNPNALAPNTGQTAPPPGYAQSFGRPQAQRMLTSNTLSNESFTINWDAVQQIAQPTDVSCWATAASMVLGWRDQQSIDINFIAERAGLTTATGLDPAQVGQFASDMGLVAESPQSYTVDGFHYLVANNGPLWVGAAVPGLHAIVVTGIYSDGSNTFVRITDPWDRDIGQPGSPGSYANTHTTGSRYIMHWSDFVAEYEKAATDFSAVNLQILHAGGAFGQMANTGGSTPVGYAMSAGRSSNTNPRKPLPPPRARSLAETAVPRAIGGKTIETESSVQGNVTCDFDSFHGPKHPGNIAPATGGAFSDAPTIRFEWPTLDAAGGVTGAAIAIDWLYDGRSIGDVRISSSRVWNGEASLHVQGEIIDDDVLYQPGDCAALQIRLSYRFKPNEGPEVTAITNVHLYGDGTHEAKSHWVPAGAQALAKQTSARAQDGGVSTVATVIGTLIALVGGGAVSNPAWLQTKHPGDTPPPGARTWTKTRVVTKNTPESSGPLPFDNMGANFTVEWEHDGLSLRNIFFYRDVNTAVLNDVEVVVDVIPREATHSIWFNMMSPLVATIELQFTYTFIHKSDQDEVAIHRMRIYGDGSKWQADEPEWVYGPNIMGIRMNQG